MPTIQLSNSVTTAGVANILSGNTFEFLPYDARVAMGFTAASAGITLDVLVGSDVEATQFVPLVKATSPIIPDDMAIVFEAFEGSRLTIRAASTGTIVLLTTVKIDPM